MIKSSELLVGVLGVSSSFVWGGVIYWGSAKRA